ncbi:MAG: oligopeptide ABC transporter substrate-binding protein [Kurthia sp.]|nr:oligopeptide ABC transporter substrate-binding protein [Candidatus Kurthia equi]
MKKKSSFFISILAIVFLVLSACGSNPQTNKTKVDTSKLPDTYENKDEVTKGGTLKVALATDAPFQGLFTYELYEDGFDFEILNYTSNSLYGTKEDFLIDGDGIAKLAVDEKANTATITIPKDIKWSDDKPFTADDIIYPYYIIADKDYTGVRYDTDFQNIVGVKDYHDGKAKDISGIKKVDDYTVEIAFNKISPAIYSGGDGLWGYAAPKHQLKKIKVADLEKADAVRKNPVTLGAFVINKLVKGESVELVANKNYWKGQPKLDKVVIETVPSASIAAALKAGKYDVVAPNYPANDYDSIKDFKNITILGRQELAYSYLGFKEGKLDKKTTTVITDPNAKMSDPKLRQAVAYAMNIEDVADKYYDGLRTRANSLIPPVFKTYYDDGLKGYKFDKKKAESLLDEAGYKDTDKDGIREGKDGKPFVIKLASMAGSDKDEKIVQFYIQNWKEVGLKVELTTGRLIEFNAFYDKVGADDKEIDMFMGAWGTGTNPSPMGLYSKNAEFNYSRYTTDEQENLLKEIDSVEALDPKFRGKAFKSWQEYMYEQATTIPMYFRTELIPVNNRVKNWDINWTSKDMTMDNLQDVELTAKDPIK